MSRKLLQLRYFSLSQLKTSYQIAWRNLWRNKRRTLLTMFASAFASTILVFFVSLQFSSYASMINVATSVFHGHMQIQLDSYLDEPELEKTIMNPDLMKEKIIQVPGISYISSRAESFGLASARERTFGVQFIGVEPEQEVNVSTVPNTIRKGRYLNSKSSLEAVIGENLANNLKVSIGDSITMLGQAKGGGLAASVVTIVGIFVSGTREVDASMVHIPIKDFQEIFNLEDEVNSFVLKLDDLDYDVEVQKKIATALTDINQARKTKIIALRWDQLLPGIKQAINLDMVSGWLFYFGLVLVVVFSVLNTCLMSVLERTKEFGILKALGTKTSQVNLILFFESSFLTFLGIILGMLFGSLIVTYYGIYGFHVPGAQEIMKMWNVQTALFPKISIASLLLGPALILLVSYIALIYPLLLLSRLQPIEAMRRS